MLIEPGGDCHHCASGTIYVMVLYTTRILSAFGTTVVKQ